MVIPPAGLCVISRAAPPVTSTSKTRLSAVYASFCDPAAQVMLSFYAGELESFFRVALVKSYSQTCCSPPSSET